MSEERSSSPKADSGEGAPPAQGPNAPRPVASVQPSSSSSSGVASVSVNVASVAAVDAPASRSSTPEHLVIAEEAAENASDVENQDPAVPVASRAAVRRPRPKKVAKNKRRVKKARKGRGRKKYSPSSSASSSSDTSSSSSSDEPEKPAPAPPPPATVQGLSDALQGINRQLSVLTSRLNGFERSLTHLKNEALTPDSLVSFQIELQGDLRTLGDRISTLEDEAAAARPPLPP